MHVKGKLQSEGSKTSLTANVNGRVFKSWLVDQEGTLHLFTKVYWSPLQYRTLTIHLLNTRLSSRIQYMTEIYYFQHLHR